MSHADTKRLFPLIEDEYESVYISGAARVDGYSLRRALIRGAKKHGAKIIKGNAQLSCKNGKINGVIVNGETREASTVVATTGAWMKELVEPLGMNLQVFPQKAQIIHLEMVGQNTKDWPVVMPPNNQYILPFDQNRIIIGATHETKAGFDFRLTTGGVHEILTKALNIAPKLANSTVIKTKVGFRPFTQDSLPIIGRLPGFNNLIIANGLGASGLTTGPYIGTQLAKLVLAEDLNLNLDDYDVANALK